MWETLTRVSGFFIILIHFMCKAVKQNSELHLWKNKLRLVYYIEIKSAKLSTYYNYRI